MVSKKAVASTVYMIIIGLLLFIILSYAIANGAIKAFKSYKGAEKTLDELTDSIGVVANSSNHVALKLVTVEMEEETAIFIFQKNTDLILQSRSTGLGMDKNIDLPMLITKPADCQYDQQCICLCKEFELKSLAKDYTPEELNEKYASKYPEIAPVNMYEINCGKEISCKIKNDFEIPSHINLADIMSSNEMERLEHTAKTEQTGGKKQEYIYSWEGGFVFWRLSDETQNTFQSKQFMTSKYVDLYVVSSGAYTNLCFDPECKTLTLTRIE